MPSGVAGLSDGSRRRARPRGSGGLGSRCARSGGRAGLLPLLPQGISGLRAWGLRRVLPCTQPGKAPKASSEGSAERFCAEVSPVGAGFVLLPGPEGQPSAWEKGGEGGPEPILCWNTQPVGFFSRTTEPAAIQPSNYWPPKGEILPLQMTLVCLITFGRARTVLMLPSWLWLFSSGPGCLLGRGGHGAQPYDGSFLCGWFHWGVARGEMDFWDALGLDTLHFLLSMKPGGV